jgi:hypothetical protein
LDLIDLDIDVDGLVTLCEPYLGSQNPNLDVNDIIGANDTGISHRKSYRENSSVPHSAHQHAMVAVHTDNEQTSDEQTPTTPVPTAHTPAPEPAPAPTLLGRTRQQTRAQQVLDTLLRLTPRARTLSPVPETESEPIILTPTQDDNNNELNQHSSPEETILATSVQDEHSISSNIHATEEDQDEEHQLNEATDESKVGIDRENMDRVLASHVRTTVDELNKALDDADEEDDGALANDLVNRARQLLNDGLKTKSARKLQNWINVTEQCYRPQLEQLNPSEHVINAIQYFDELIEDAQKYYDKWLHDETTKHLRKQKDDLRKLKKSPKTHRQN